ncbi:benzoate/H(+) symporter BenE family transporter [Granulosicoccus sp. 3-233]|uniref:benzoate/H(+) symporter BenE family transporter n=1 Tax=Granulosicoccus sp. 3-233 TaxID=3417969 RepID=UPI003D355AB5
MTELTLSAGGEQPAGKRLDDASWKAFGTGVLGSIVGYTCSFAIVLQGLRSAGATEAQAISGLVALSIGMGISGIVLAFRFRMPVSVAWSTPGAALLIASGDTLGSVNEAIGTYLFSAVLLMIAGWVRPLGRLIEAIPASLANAMLAGVLLPICLAPVHALAYDAWLAMPLLLTWWLVGRVNRFFAVPAALLVLLPLVAWRLGLPDDLITQLRASLIPHVEFIRPVFDPQALISIGIPLFVVTMASQNVPGVAILRAHGYKPKAGPLILNTGFFSLLSAPFGALGINLAALTAAMLCSEDAHENPERRYWAAVFAGISYLGWGMITGVMGLFIVLVPAVLVEAIAGLALLGSFSAALAAALADTRQREASAITFLFAGSGLAFMGVGGAFWGLLVGALMYLLVDYQKGRKA